MYILVQTQKGKEFIYSPSTAHQVSKNSAEKIKNVLNQLKYKIKNEGQIWHTYEVYEIDIAYNYAMFQRFTIRNGVIKEKIGC